MSFLRHSVPGPRLCYNNYAATDVVGICVMGGSKKLSPEVSGFFTMFEIFNQNFTHVFHAHIQAKLQNFIQLSPTLTKLCHIMRDLPVIFLDFSHASLG